MNLVATGGEKHGGHQILDFLGIIFDAGVFDQPKYIDDIGEDKDRYSETLTRFFDPR